MERWSHSWIGGLVERWIAWCRGGGIDHDGPYQTDGLIHQPIHHEKLEIQTDWWRSKVVERSNDWCSGRVVSGWTHWWIEGDVVFSTTTPFHQWVDVSSTLPYFTYPSINPFHVETGTDQSISRPHRYMHLYTTPHIHQSVYLSSTPARHLSIH